MTTIATIFSGGEGVGVGARAAGLDHLWGIEYDDAIASVARANGFNTLTGNVMDTALMMSLPRPDVLHASPVCKNASNAKANGEESPLDIATADATCAYMEHFRPDIFTLENVWGYRTFEAFAHILICLKRNGYNVDYWHLNAADMGVPQTRKRLILVARLHGKPRRPVPTHARPDKITPMFDMRLPWVGWYAAIEDLIDTLPASRFADWQLARLPVEIQEVMIGGGNRSQSFLEWAKENRPDTPGKRKRNEPAHAVSATASSDVRAFILTDQSSSAGEGVQVLDADQPATTLRSFETGGNRSRAFIVQGANIQSNGKIYNVDTDPALTNDTSAQPRAWLSSGRVVKMTPRALARFQSIPDWYALPDKTRLACTVIGNAVPPLLYKRVIEAQLMQVVRPDDPTVL